MSSRGRYPRYWREWSSDVCSADLRANTSTSSAGSRLVVQPDVGVRGASERDPAEEVEVFALRESAALLHDQGGVRSEERRVGKEWRFRWSPDHLKKKESAVRCRAM